jgi:hypothetical protein
MLETERNFVDRDNQTQSKTNRYNALVAYRGLDASGKSDLVKIQNQGGQV